MYFLVRQKCFHFIFYVLLITVEFHVLVAFMNTYNYMHYKLREQNFYLTMLNIGRYFIFIDHGKFFNVH